MIAAAEDSLTALYVEDETAWLEEMADLVRRRNAAGLDWDNLSEYLTDMATRERREVKSRLVVLMAHLLKWEFQPERRSRSWGATVLEQRQRLDDHAHGGVLREHAENILVDAYEDAVELAVYETGLPRSTFPTECPYSVEQLLAIELSKEHLPERDS